MRDYYKFRASSLDTADVGLHTGAETSGSVFTPQNATVIGWAGDSHFCFVEGFDETVFSVDPSAAPGEYVQPVAGSFSDFLGLLTACKDTLPIRQAYQWSRGRFEEFVNNRRPSMKQRSILRALENTYRPPVIPDPYAYIRSIQAKFDYSALPLHPDYSEHCAFRPGTLRWRVCLGEDFFPDPGEGRTCRETAVGRSFTLGDEEWSVPAIYTCDRGIVVDCIARICLDKVRRFTEKWTGLTEQNLTRQQQLELEAEQPFHTPVSAALKIGGNTLHNYTERTLRWNPLTDNHWPARKTAEHYGLDPENAWVIRRFTFSHKIKKDAVLTPLTMIIKPQPVKRPGSCFTVAGAGDSLEFTHPATGTVHTLTVEAYSREELDPNFLYDLPRHYTQMTYTIRPEPEENSVSIQDTLDNDPVRQVQGSVPDGAGIIGGADGPTAVLVPFPRGKRNQTAISALHYTPVSRVRWQLVFRERRGEDRTVPLLEQETP